MKDISYQMKDISYQMKETNDTKLITCLSDERYQMKETNDTKLIAYYDHVLCTSETCSQPS